MAGAGGRWRTIAVTVSSVVVFSAAALPIAHLRLFSDRPPLAHTGGFGEQTCRQCHFDNPLNDSTGALALDGVPASYTPGATYTLTVRVRRTDLARGGFQLASRVAEGLNAGKQAGEFGVVDSRVNLGDTVLTSYGQVQYPRHSRDASPPRDSVRWVLKWTAPAARTGAVVFHVAANAANDDDSPLGDFIYAAVVSTHQESAVRRSGGSQIEESTNRRSAGPTIRR